MTKLEELLKETEFTQEEYEIHRKVVRNNQLEDLLDLLEEMLGNGTISKKNYKLAHERAGIIIAKYDKWLDYEWRETMKNAIDWVVKGE